MTEVFLIFFFLSQGFVQKWYIPHTRGPGRICIADAARDANYEFIFSDYHGSYTIYFYELHLPITWEIDSVTNLAQPLLWDIGDFDLDGHYDIVMQSSWGAPVLGISVYESPDSFSYPTQEVWRDTVGFALVQPISAFDVDKDNYPEIFKLGWKKEDTVTTYYPFGIYEYTSDNHYDTIFMGTGLGSLSSTIAFGDFDSDGFNEFVIGNIDGYYQLWECAGNDTYQLLHQHQLPTANIKDCFAVPDMDGDDKLEFVVKGFTVPNAEIHCFIFEATGDNTYEIIKSFTFSGGYDWYGGGHSDTGDVDGDSIPEIVLEGCQTIYIIKSCGNDSFYVWQTLPGNYTGSSVRIADIDNNGLNEIVISGSNYTRIYEKTPIVTWFWPTPYDTAYANDTVYPRWKLDETIALDSLRLYWSNPQFGCHLIYQGLPTDTICSWVVPDTQSNYANRFWLVVKGLGRYDSTYSPVFHIKRPQGIEEAGISLSEQISLEVYPNPFKGATSIKLQIPVSRQNPEIKSPNSLCVYDVMGRLVKTFFLPGNIFDFTLQWDGTDDNGQRLCPGIYFVDFKGDGYRIIKKLIILR